MSYSLNELASLCRKAARGAGYSWGMAEEAGRAARWLEAQGYLGAKALAGLLEATDGTPPTAPNISSIWHAAQPLCPITTGAALVDHSFLLTDGPIQLGPTRYPLLLLPFADAIGAVDLKWNGDLGTTETAQVTIRKTTTAKTSQPSYSRSNLTPDLYARLSHYAARTYAPATDASRLAGAGAGLSDND